ncbi:serine hydrolase domain-containing protein [Tenacibaculum amylolyticum]|uniref:serine hydrolase domain-containing protein n=1 Tax=Tenacibaculum amylolyticum TaxID=104269 RepID=UPI00389512A3
MKNLVISLGVLLSISLLIACHTQKEKFKIETSHIQKIDSLFKNYNKEDAFSGGVVITNYGEVLYENYFGLADRTWNIPFNKEVKLDIASVNKSMIAVLVLKAVEEGKIMLNDRLVNVFSKYTYEGNFHPNITVHHLLSHTSGLPDYNAVAMELQQERFLKFKRLRFTNKEYINFISKLTPVGGPENQFYYSNFGYHLLTILLEDIYEKPFETILKENLTAPLGLKNTTSQSSNEAIISKLAPAYVYKKEKAEWNQNPFIDLTLGRRIFSTPEDLNRWGQVMDNSGYLSEKSLKLMKKNHSKDISKKISYGYGWVTVYENNYSEMGNLNIVKPYIIHGGSTDGYKAMLININESEYVISFLSNVDKTRELELAQRIVTILIK